MKSFFVTAVGTDIGKTFFTCNICRNYINKGFKVQAIKPVISGWGDVSSDTHLLLDSIGYPITQYNIDKISPWRFKEPLSPNIASRMENKTIDFDLLVDFCKESLAKSKANYFFIESVGGVMSPLTDDKTSLDLATELDLPLIVITGTYLGSISHSLTAIESAKNRGVKINCMIVNESEDSHVDIKDTVSTIKNFTNVPIYTITRNHNFPVIDL